jgi:hypothetical protein
VFKKIFGNSFRITKAAQIGKQEFAIDLNPSKHFGTFSKEAGEFNATIDGFIAEFDPNDKELAVFLLAPVMDSVAANTGHRALVRDVIRCWLKDGDVRADVADMALQELA